MAAQLPPCAPLPMVREGPRAAATCKSQASSQPAPQSHSIVLDLRELRSQDDLLPNLGLAPQALLVNFSTSRPSRVNRMVLRMGPKAFIFLP